LEFGIRHNPTSVDSSANETPTLREFPGSSPGICHKSALLYRFARAKAAKAVD